jgi:hypothetical protein
MPLIALLIGSLHQDANVKRKKMRDTKVIENFIKENYRKIKEMSLFRHLKKEVETGANGTQDYVIKEGQNKGKKANVK